MIPRSPHNAPEATKGVLGMSQKKRAELRRLWAELVIEFRASGLGQTGFPSHQPGPPPSSFKKLNRANPHREVGII